MSDQANAASVAVFDGDRVLVIQRARAPWRGLWSLPGGRLEVGESAEDCAVRELAEEVGLRVSGLVPVRRMYFGEGSGFILQVFATQSFEGLVRPNDEISGYRWLRAAQWHDVPTTPQLDEVLAEAAQLLKSS